MDEIRRAKEKAEKYLNWVVEQNWDSSFKMEADRSAFEYCEELDWPQRFEAYCYLGHRDKSKITSFAAKLRDLWDDWIELNKKGYLGKDQWGRKNKFFWPVQPETESIKKHGRLELLSPFENELENHISMFRTKEILGIGGFDAYFNEAKKKIIDMFFSEDPPSVGYTTEENWRTVRSPILELDLSDYLRQIADNIIKDGELKSLFKPKKKNVSERTLELPVFDNIKIAFFLCVGNFNDKLVSFAQKAASNLIDSQRKNGSFGASVLTTCLCATSIYVVNADPSRTVCNKAIEYILDKQSEEGCWDYEHSFENNLMLWGIPPSNVSIDSIGRNTFTTVLTLETLDLISNDKPLPIWAEKTKILETYPIQKPSRIQPAVSFKIPEGINWHYVTIRFLSDEGVHIKAGSAFAGFDFIGMGFVDRRRRLKERRPDWSWKTLKEIANHQGEISINDADIDPTIKKNLKSYIHVIRERLKKFFGIEEDPFEPYCRRTKSWKAKFTIIDESQE